MQTGGRGRAIAIVAGTLVLALVVAFASRPVQVATGGAANNSAIQLLTDTGLYLLLVVMVVVLGAIIWALWPDSLRRERRPHRPWWQYLVSYASLAVLMGLGVLLLTKSQALRRLRQTTAARMLPGLQGQQPPVPLHGATRPPAGPDWTAIIIVVVIVAAVVALIVWRWLVERRRRPTPRELARDLEEVLEQGIVDLRGGEAAPLEAREAVIAAWAGFERVLARAGVPVRPGEAPHEYLTRALGVTELTLDGTALRAFTDLFEWARYSTNPVTEEMRDQAVATLTAVRDGLHHSTPDDGLHAVPA